MSLKAKEWESGGEFSFLTAWWMKLRINMSWWWWCEPGGSGISSQRARG